MQHLTIRMLRRLEGQARRPVQLAHDYPLGAVDDKRPLRSHQRQFTHENLFFLGVLLFLQEKSDIERRSVGYSFAQAFQPILLRLANIVAVIIQHALAVVALNGKHFAEDRLQTDVLAPAGRHIQLQKLLVRSRLQLNQIGRSDDFFDFAEINSFVCSRWHFGPDSWLARGQAVYLLLTTEGKRPGSPETLPNSEL